MQCFWQLIKLWAPAQQFTEFNFPAAPLATRCRQATARSPLWQSPGATETPQLPQSPLPSGLAVVPPGCAQSCRIRQRRRRRHRRQRASWTELLRQTPAQPTAFAFHPVSMPFLDVIAVGAALQQGMAPWRMHPAMPVRTFTAVRFQGSTPGQTPTSAAAVQLSARP